MALTPGPWAYDPTINRIFSTVTNECVAAPHVPGNPAADAAWPDDARVLAAGPEMLEALKRLIEPTPGVSKLPAWVYGIVVPVIAKAEGRS